MASTAVIIQDSLFTVSLTIIAKVMDMVPTARVVSIVRTATPADSEPVTAWEASDPLVLLHLALNKFRRREAEAHQGLVAEPA